MCGLKAAGIPFQLELKLWCHHDGQRAHLTLIQGSSIYHIYHWLISLGEFFQWWQGHQRLADGENSWPAYHGMRHPSGIRPCTGTCNPDCDSGRVFRPRHKLGWCKRNKLFPSVGRCRCQWDTENFPSVFNAGSPHSFLGPASVRSANDFWSKTILIKTRTY